MKNTYILGAFAVLLLTLSVASPALAARHHTSHHQQQIVTLSTPQDWAVSGSLNLGSNLSKNKNHASSSGSGTTQPTTTPVAVPPTTPPVIVPIVPPVTTIVSATGEVRMTAYTTGYGWPDNTPAGGAISNPVIHQTAGGTGTYADPITLAVGHSIINGQDILDYPQGTKFYIPNLRKYFIVEDTCGDGNQPQNGPCHTGYQGHVWVDLWVGGQGLSSNGTLACEDTITDLHTIIENPASNYAVVPGPVYNGTCATQYGETVVTQ